MFCTKNIFAAMSAALSLMIAGCSDSAERIQLPINGEWETPYGFVKLPGTTDEAEIGDTITDLHSTLYLQRRHSLTGKVRYTRQVTIPESFEGKQLTLFLERTKPTTVYVDSICYGSQNHINAPHRYNLTGLTAGTHTLSIEVDNTLYEHSDPAVANGLPALIGGSHAITDHTQTNWNGILGEMYIEAKNNINIAGIKCYPDVDSLSVKINVNINNALNVSQACKMHVQIETFNTGDYGKEYSDCKDIEFQLQGEQQTASVKMPLDKHNLWSEFHPTLHRVTVKLTTPDGSDVQTTTFGARKFATRGTQFTINGKATFLRGKHDGCVFPLTGYAPMTVDEWRKVFAIAKSYGINHYRFHSWAPPKACFEAADIEGIYLQPECPFWGTIDREDTVLCNYLFNEAQMLLDEFGNHASYVMMAFGNEIFGDYTLLREWANKLRSEDNRRLYAFGSNNGLGYPGQQPDEDFWVTCRTGAEEAGKFNTHTRASFSFADTYDGGILNNLPPNTYRTYAEGIKGVTVPVISHETCQFQIYPDSLEIYKYTGVVRPVNHEEFLRRLKNAGLAGMSHNFHTASGALSMLLYKADMEMCLRTRGFGGFQLLDLQDYPGQGSALVGPLDAFMQSKGLITPDEFRQFCSPIVSLAHLDRFVFNPDSIKFRISVANYSENDIKKATLNWSIVDENNNMLAHSNIDFSAPQGDVQLITGDEIAISLSEFISKPTKLKLLLNIDGISFNSYNIWAMPQDNVQMPEYATTVDKAIEMAQNTDDMVLFVPDHADILDQSVGSLFYCDYWNYAMFKKISQNNNQPISPGTLGYFVDTTSVFANNFVTSCHTDWQWWRIAKNTRPIIINGTSITPLVWAIDNADRVHKLAVLMQVGNVVVCATDLKKIASSREGIAYIEAIKAQLKNKSARISKSDADMLKMLFTRIVAEQDLKAFNNYSDYKKQ